MFATESLIVEDIEKTKYPMTLRTFLSKFSGTRPSLPTVGCVDSIYIGTGPEGQAEPHRSEKRPIGPKRNPTCVIRAPKGQALPRSGYYICMIPYFNFEN